MKLIHLSWWKHLLRICGRFKTKYAINGKKFHTTKCNYCLSEYLDNNK